MLKSEKELLRELELLNIGKSYAIGSLCASYAEAIREVEVELELLRSNHGQALQDE